MDGLQNRKTLCDIANFTFNIVNDWLDSDQQLASDLRSDETGSRQFVSEEAITADIARKLRTQFPHHVDVKLFTHPEEKRTGADWYWRIERGGHAIHALVQAKRVQRTDFSQPDDQGHIDINHAQLGRLLLATKKASQRIAGLKAWLATYARFDASPPCGYDNLQHCQHHCHTNDCQGSQPSLWLANAHEIADSDLRRRPVQEIIRHSLRLDCILPCFVLAGNLGPAINDFVLQSDLSSFETCVTTIENDPQLSAKIKGALLIRE